MRLEPDEKAYEDQPVEADEIKPRTSVYLVREVQKAAREYARAHGWTFSKLVTLSLREYMKTHG